MSDDDPQLKEIITRRLFEAEEATKKEKAQREAGKAEIRDVRELLTEHGLTTGEWKHIAGTTYGANSPYLEFDKSNSPSVALPNNLAFYATGTYELLLSYKLVLNIHDSSNASRDKRVLSQAFNSLAQKLGLESSIVDEIEFIGKRPVTTRSDGFEIVLSGISWPTGKGYELQIEIARTAP